MTATEERNKPVDGRDVARRLRETGALDGLFEQIDSGQARDDRSSPLVWCSSGQVVMAGRAGQPGRPARQR